MSKSPRMKTSQGDKRAAVHVLGCKVNQAEAAAMAGILERKGYQITPDCPEPDLVLVNTCCVTAKAEAKSRRAVKRLAEKYPTATILVTGCLAEINPSSLSGFSERMSIFGTFEKERFAQHAGDIPENAHGILRRGALECTDFSDMGTCGIPGHSRTFLKVQDGCSQGCTYCIVPAARGPSRSLSPDAVINSARNLAEQGYAEIVLTGIHLGHYGRDLSPTMCLEDLLERLLSQCPSARFRLSSIEPQELTKRLITLASEHPGVCRHFHVPVQSGDDRILKRMGRPYRTELLRNLREVIVAHIPDACVGFDIMVGFPGEDEQSFQVTEAFIREARPAYLHVFPFSPRPGTPAAQFKPRVPASEARSRVEQLRALSKTLKNSFHERFLGRDFTVVPESRSEYADDLITVRTDNYIPVRVRVPSELSEIPTFEVTLTRIYEGEVLGVVKHGPAGFSR
jgi:threonylcarbamoyladenosine tRNA methylthiotransferase MtaB